MSPAITPKHSVEAVTLTAFKNFSRRIQITLAKPSHLISAKYKISSGFLACFQIVGDYDTKPKL